MEIIIGESENFEQGRSGLISGEIFIQQNSSYFPEKGWTDFVVIILGWWVNSFLNYVKDDLKKFEFSFMDGPYKIIGLELHNNKIEMYSWGQHEGEIKEVFLGYTDKWEIQKLLLRTCRKLFRTITMSGISEYNLDVLQKMFNELKQLQF